MAEIPDQLHFESMVTGLVESMVAFGVALANRGLIGREEIAGTMEELIEQQRRHGAGDLAARAMVPTMLAQMFRMPVAPGLQVIEGGKAPSSAPAPDDPDPPRAA